jgi:hypothetical protein
MRQDNIDRGTQIQTEVRGYVDKAKTQTPNRLWHFTVFRPEHIHGISGCSNVVSGSLFS